MLTSVHLVDDGVRATVGAIRHTPSPGAVPGLRDARTLIAAPLGQSPPVPQLGRRALVAFWEDEAALGAFLATDARAADLTGGWSVRLEPLRAVSIVAGPWPGLTPDVPSGEVDERSDPTVVLTIGHLRATRAIPFLRASARAERDVVRAPGLLWSTGLANIGQRVVATFSIWESGRHLRAYATEAGGHVAAMQAQDARSFHHVASFIRYRPRAASGSLAGRNPLPASLTAALNRPPAADRPQSEPSASSATGSWSSTTPR
jgi:hypothetical protein